MKIFFSIIAALLIPVICFADTNSQLPTETPPAYNACNGVLIEAIPAGDAIYLTFTIAEGQFAASTISGTPVSFEFTIAVGSELSRNTNSNFLAETPPAYNECDGALIETFPGTPIYFSFTIAEGAFVQVMGGTPITFNFTIAKPIQKIHFSQGIQFDQGITFEGGNYIRWTGNPKAAAMMP